MLPSGHVGRGRLKVNALDLQWLDEERQLSDPCGNARRLQLGFRRLAVATHAGDGGSFLAEERSNLIQLCAVRGEVHPVIRAESPRYAEKFSGQSQAMLINPVFSTRFGITEEIGICLPYTTFSGGTFLAKVTSRV